jgi:hypothetical protein
VVRVARYLTDDYRLLAKSLCLASRRENCGCRARYLGRAPRIDVEPLRVARRRQLAEYLSNLADSTRGILAKPVELSLTTTPRLTEVVDCRRLHCVRGGRCGFCTVMQAASNLFVDPRSDQASVRTIGIETLAYVRRIQRRTHMRIRLLGLVAALGLVAGGIAITPQPVAAATTCSSRSATFSYNDPVTEYYEGLPTGYYGMYVRITAYGCYNGTTSWGYSPTSYSYWYNREGPIWIWGEDPRSSYPYYQTTFSAGHGYSTIFSRYPVFATADYYAIMFHTFPNITLSGRGAWSLFDGGAGVSGDCNMSQSCQYFYGSPLWAPVFLGAWWS